MEFIECDELIDLRGNRTRDDSGVGGCYKVVTHCNNNRIKYLTMYFTIYGFSMAVVTDMKM